ncbi:MAG: hypothetical protein AB7H80_04665 [Candidatus Kapaibacterium sp.]
MILEFIDGTLDSSSEQSLFDELAGHPEMRTELRQYVMIGDAVRADREAYAPPSDVERKLFGGLGLIPMVGAGAAGTAAAAAGGGAAAGGAAAGLFSFAALKSGLLPLLTGFLLGSLLVGGGVYFWMNSSAQDQVIASAASAEAASEKMVLEGRGTSSELSAPTQLQGEKTGRDKGAVSAAANQKVSVDGREKVRVVEKIVEKIVHVPQPDATTLASGNHGGQPQQKDSDLNPSESPTDLLKARAQQNKSSVTPKNRALVEPQSLLPQDGSEGMLENRSPVSSPPIDHTKDDVVKSERSLTLEFRKGVGTQPFADNNARRVETQFVGDLVQENFVLGASYQTPFLGGLQVGLEGGRERYTQSLFYNQNDSLLIEQRPNITWFGIALGREVNLLNVPLLLQGTVGSSTHFSGPLVRGRVGVDLLDLTSISSSLSMPLSFEASSLVYTFNGQYLVTGNWGASLGVRYKFGF